MKVVICIYKTISTANITVIDKSLQILSQLFLLHNGSSRNTWLIKRSIFRDKRLLVSAILSWWRGPCAKKRS